MVNEEIIIWFENRVIFFYYEVFLSNKNVFYLFFCCSVVWKRKYKLYLYLNILFKILWVLFGFL